MSFKCPACERPLLNRRRPKCAFCGAEIPAELLMNAEQRGAKMRQAGLCINLGAITKMANEEEKRRRLKKMFEKQDDGTNRY